MEIADDNGSLDLARLETAVELWPQFVSRAGLTGGRQTTRGAYDGGLVDALHERMFPGVTGDFDVLIQASIISAENFLRAFFATLEPFARMSEDILRMLADAGARASGDALKIRFNFDEGKDPLDLLLEQFRSQMEIIASITVPAAPAIPYPELWTLVRAGFDDDGAFRSRSRPSGSAAVIQWLEDYNNGAPFAPLILGWETGNSELDDRIERVIGLLSGVLAQFRLHGQDHERLPEMSRRCAKE